MFQRFMLIGLCVLGALAGAGGPLARGAGAPAQSASTVPDLLASYADWIHGRRTGVELVAVDLDAARHELARVNPASLFPDVNPSTPQARENSRRLLTSFALELAAVGSKRHAAAAARLVEWACPYVRGHAPANDFDRAWQLAALSLLEGGIDATVLHDHLAHVQAIYPDEPRLLLARGIAEEQVSAPSEVLSGSSSAADFARVKEQMSAAAGERARAGERAIARFREAAKDDSLRAEASVRMAHVELGLHRYDEALAALADVEPATHEPSLVYLARLFRGLAFEGRRRSGDARSAYLQALEVSPGAHSATMRLAALDFRDDHGDASAALIEALLRNDDPRRDPWWSYYAGDWRFWYSRIERVRALLKGQPS
jgi:tetratricopeptide (TPR) repeat protein